MVMNAKDGFSFPNTSFELFFSNSMLRFNCTHSNKTGVYLTAITGSSYPFSKLPEDDYWAPHMQAFQSGVEKHPRKERTSKLD